MNKKYLPSALILYLNYFIHGVGCSILGQAVIKEALGTHYPGLLCVTSYIIQLLPLHQILPDRLPVAEQVPLKILQFIWIII